MRRARMSAAVSWSNRCHARLIAVLVAIAVAHVTAYSMAQAAQMTTRCKRCALPADAEREAWDVELGCCTLLSTPMVEGSCKSSLGGRQLQKFFWRRAAPIIVSKNVDPSIHSNTWTVLSTIQLLWLTVLSNNNATTKMDKEMFILNNSNSSLIIIYFLF